MSDVEQKWLVKSNSVVNGPYHFEQVVEDIFKGDIHLLDEIKGPFERWRPIRDHSLFAAAIERLKATTYQKREMTITEAVDFNTATMDITQTSTETLGADTGMTHTLTNDITASGMGNAPPMRPAAPVGGGDLQGPPTFKTAPPVPRQSHSSRFPFAFILSLILILAAGVGYILLEFQQTKNTQQTVNAFDEYTDKALVALKTGEYQEALKYFSMASEISPNDPNVILEMSPLLIQFDGQFGRVQSSVENLLATRYQKDFMKRGKNIVAMSLSYRGQFNDALGEVNKSLNVDDQYFPALINKAFFLLKLNRGMEAIDVLKRAIPMSPKEAIARYLLTRAFVQEGIRSQKPQYFSEALSTSNDFPQRFFDFRQEVLFLIAVAKLNLGAQPEELVRAARAFLQVDPELTPLHVHDVRYDFQSFRWQDFISHCESLSVKVDNYTSELIKGFCQLKLGKSLKAKNIFENLLSQKRNDGILQSLYAASLLALNDLEQAKNLISLLGGMRSPKPVAQVLLRGCLEAGDLACAQNITQSSVANGISLLYSHWSVVELNYKTNTERAVKSLGQGLGISPSFSPLLRMRKSL
ncbi:MAG: tetratricopeptide repeat protein [Bdellovibrionales bacterium]|nr:tetratricopeptide repeat protein [Bdellovibrionales bacterium]